MYWAHCQGWGWSWEHYRPYQPQAMSTKPWGERQVSLECLEGAGSGRGGVRGGAGDTESLPLLPAHPASSPTPAPAPFPHRSPQSHRSQPFSSSPSPDSLCRPLTHTFPLGWEVSSQLQGVRGGWDPGSLASPVATWRGIQGWLLPRN